MEISYSLWIILRHFEIIDATTTSVKDRDCQTVLSSKYQSTRAKFADIYHNMNNTATVSMTLAVPQQMWWNSFFLTLSLPLKFCFLLLWAQPWLYFTSCHHQSNVSVLTRCRDIQPGVPTTAQISNITQSDKTPVTRPFNSWSCFQTPSPSLLLRTECISWLDIVAVALPYQVGCWMGSLDHSGRGIALSFKL